MIKNIFLACMMFSSMIHSHTLQSTETKLFSGSIEFPSNLQYDLCLFYQGQKLSFENNQSNFVQFYFLDSKNTHTAYMLITNELTCCTKESNNVDCLSITETSSYICYKFQAKRELDQNEHQLLSWDVSQHILENNQVPPNCLIFIFDPSLIAGLKVQSWKPENAFRIIPTLVINPQTPIEEIQRAMIIARLSALDIDAIHSKSKTNNIMTMTSPTSAILTAMQ